MRLKKLLVFLLLFIVNINIVHAGVSKPLDDLATNSVMNSDLKYFYVYNCEISPELEYSNKEYMIICPMNTKKLSITYRARSVNSKVELTGNENIHNGSVIKVKVIAQNEQEKEYIFTVRYSNSKLIYTILIVLIIVILILAITALVVYILYTKGIIKFEKKKSVNIDKESYVK